MLHSTMVGKVLKIEKYLKDNPHMKLVSINGVHTFAPKTKFELLVEGAWRQLKCLLGTRK